MRCKAIHGQLSAVGPDCSAGTKVVAWFRSRRRGYGAIFLIGSGYRREASVALICVKPRWAYRVEIDRALRGLLSPEARPLERATNSVSATESSDRRRFCPYVTPWAPRVPSTRLAAPQFLAINRFSD